MNDYRDSQSGDATIMTRFLRELRKNRILKSPTKYYISLALTEEDLSQIGEAIRQSAKALVEVV